MDMLYYFLPGILILGMITSFTDIKYGKIKNKWVISALIYGLIINLVLIFYYSYLGSLNLEYVSELLVNVGFGLLVGFGFWWFGMWTAGDGKLFFAYSILVPLTAYQHGYIKWAPSTILLINVFVPMFFYFFVISLFRSDWKTKKTVIKEMLSSKVLNLFISLFAIHWFIGLFSSITKLNGFFSRMVLITFIFYIIDKKFKTKKHKKHLKLILVVLAVCGIRLIFDKSVCTLYFWKEFLFLFIFLSLFRGIVNLGTESFCTAVFIKNLKPGMLLAETIVKKGKKYEKKKKQGLFNLEKGFIEEEAEGITLEDIKRIKKTGIKKIKIKQTLPFAPFMFFGVLLTLIVKGNILILVRFLIQW